MNTARFIVADVFDGLATLEDGSVDLVVTSPPFLALRSYLPADHPDKGKEIGSEPTPAEFIDTLLAVTAELRRVLAPHGSIAVELGDTYAGSGGAGGDYGENGLREGQPKFKANPGRNSGTRYQKPGMPSIPAREYQDQLPKAGEGWPLAKSKALIPQLYEVALAYGLNPLTGAESPAGQWRIRNVVTWARPNPPVGALGDKWRPATSDVIVACLSGKRYWDDMATRRPHSPNTNRRNARAVSARENTTPSGQRDGNWDTLAITDDKNPAGAPLLDYWEIPPGGYPGSHYAVYPPALVEPLVKAMCPEKVCRTCGEPSRRLTSAPQYVSDKKGTPVEKRRWLDSERQTQGAIGVDSGVQRQVETTGWTDCGHGSIACNHCGVLVPSDYAAIRRSRETSPGQTGVGQEEVLGEPVEGPSGQAEASEGVRDMRGGLPRSVGNDEDVQPILLGQTGTQGGSDAQLRGGPGQSDMEGRTQGEPSGVHPDLGSAGVSGSTEERLHDGASSGDAGTSGPPAGTVGVGSSQERDQGRQSDREPGDREPREASGVGDLSELRDGVSTPLDGYACPCGSTDFKYVADQYRPGIVLDPFAGSGTTLEVAVKWGRDAIGFDLDERNADLARERVGDSLFHELVVVRGGVT